MEVQDLQSWDWIGAKYGVRVPESVSLRAWESVCAYILQPLASVMMSLAPSFQPLGGFLQSWIDQGSQQPSCIALIRPQTCDGQVQRLRVAK